MMGQRRRRRVNQRWRSRSKRLRSQTNHSGSKVGSSVELLSAIPLNDDLHRAKALVAEPEAKVLLDLTAKMESDLDSIDELLNSIIRLDMINARALSFGGTRPDLLLVELKDILCEAEAPTSSYGKREWKLYLPKAHHPLLLQRHKLSLRKAQKMLLMPLLFMTSGDQKEKVEGCIRNRRIRYKPSRTTAFLSLGERPGRCSPSSS